MKVIITFLWAFLGIIESIKNFSSKESKYSLILFLSLYGYFYTVPSYTHDIYRLVELFKDAYDKPFSDFFKIVSGLYFDSEIKPDFMLNFMAFFASRFTNNQGFFIMLLAFVSSIFYLRIFNKQHKIYSNYKNRNSLFFIIFLVIIIPFYYIGQWRFYSASLVFILGTICVLEDKKNIKNYFLLISSIFFHFSFLLMVTLFLVYIFIGNKNRIYLIILVLSFLISDYSSSFLMKYLPEFSEDTSYQRAAVGYTGEVFQEQIQMQKKTTDVWTIRHFRNINLYYFAFCLILIYFTYKGDDKFLKNTISFLLLFLSFLNLFQGVEIVNQRFSVVFTALVCILLIKFFVVNKQFKLNKLTIIGAVAFLINFTVFFRYLLEYTNVKLFLPTPLMFLFNDVDFSLLNLIK